MNIEDYEGVFALWQKIHGFGIRSLDDSREGIEIFLKRNPTTSVVTVMDGKIVGSILCGHDGRQGHLYHVCVDEEYRRHGIGEAMVETVMEALKKEKINKVCLNAFISNEVGNRFWQKLGWTRRDDMYDYEHVLNPDNVVVFQL